jgi:hypothetical protein
MKRFATILAIALFGIATQYTYAQEFIEATAVGYEAIETEIAYPDEIVTEEVCCAETIAGEPIHAASPSFIQRYGFLLLLSTLVIGSIIFATIIIVVVVKIIKNKNKNKNTDELQQLIEENRELHRQQEIARLKKENEHLRNNLK